MAELQDVVSYHSLWYRLTAIPAEWPRVGILVPFMSLNPDFDAIVRLVTKLPEDTADRTIPSCSPPWCCVNICG